MINRAFEGDSSSTKNLAKISKIEGDIGITKTEKFDETRLRNYLENHVVKESTEDKIYCKKVLKDVGWSSLNITVEPIRFFVFFITAFTNGITIDLMELSVCQQKFNLSLSECATEVTPGRKTSLESDLATVLMLRDLVKGVFPVVLVLFLGPWSDKNGRKPWLLWVLKGFAASHFLWLILSFFPFLPVYWFLIPGIPYSFSGGLVTINICTWSYVCDIYNSDERPFRFSIFSMVGIIGTLVGNLTAAEVFHMSGKYGYQVAFSTTTIIALLTLIYTYKCLHETVQLEKGHDSTRLFEFSNIMSVFKVLLLNPAFGRLKTYFVLLTLTIEITTRTGDDDLSYLIGKSEYSWKLRNYNLFSSLTYFISAMFPVTGVWLLQEKLKLHNHVVLLVAGVIFLLSELLRCFSMNEAMFWAASCLLMTTSFIGPNIDTELSKCVTEDNLGKACAFVSLIDASTPILSIPMYTRLYQYLLPGHKTLHTYLLSAGLSSVLIISVSCLFITHRLEKKQLLIFREDSKQRNGSHEQDGDVWSWWIHRDFTINYPHRDGPSS